MGVFYTNDNLCFQTLFIKLTTKIKHKVDTHFTRPSCKLESYTNWV